MLKACDNKEVFVTAGRCNGKTWAWGNMLLERLALQGMMNPIPDRVIFNDPATVIIWKDGTKTVVKCMEGEDFDPEKGFAMCYLKKVLGKEYGATMRKYVKPELKKREEPEVQEFTFTGVRADNIQEAMQKLGMVIDQQTGYKAKHDKAKEQKNG